MTSKQLFIISLVVVLLGTSFSVYGAPKQKVFGATMHNLNNPFFVALNEGIKQVVESRDK